jgi:hypothetical protein
MLRWLNALILRTEFKKVELPIRVNDETITLLAPNNMADLVKAFFIAHSKIQSDLLEELHGAFNALTKSTGKSPEEDAERLVVLNMLRSKYLPLFNALDELNEMKTSNKETNAT